MHFPLYSFISLPALKGQAERSSLEGQGLKCRSQVLQGIKRSEPGKDAQQGAAWHFEFSSSSFAP